MSVVIYTTNYCPYCVKAKTLLDKRNIPYQEVDVTQDPFMREELVRRTGGRKTVPQIFINGLSIGGCDDLYALEAQGGLQGLSK